jgi:deazaflavin-dependent oxidoreductase (nitroreductase family)
MTATAPTNNTPTRSVTTRSVETAGAATEPGQDIDPIYLLADTDPEAMKTMNTGLITAFRAAGGRLGGAFEGVPLLLLTTIGARHGRACTTPVNYTRYGAGYVVVASKSGSPRHPDWYHNLRAHPEATIELPGATLPVRARITRGIQRQRLFDRHAAVLPNFALYQHRTTRELPVIVLEPRG